ncbi:hypothetical protein GUITHDRAFT_107824 [Guillardia theta CCMP2712]|uniref:Kinesin motor domain-containing protein n=1 Tax=Guillardia theta (strain CCMP2712) TaxID=905079 RepID=L1JCF1_GUITC|nr:hypothetical protein GUITHDRAFT_107824 [Guillardia theta CCMP2712]EKX46206.1 hypothetical protein GUITHDRAFT_107824 [Guillardia theta CCMP2712]|eukprot:XP_005833186.1 hypothetical protein GUITHDRAFT_107824 [Guillardia theta CCMP2712]
MRTNFSRRPLSTSIVQLTVRVSSSSSRAASHPEAADVCSSFFLVDLASFSTSAELEAQGSNMYKSLYTLRLILQRLSDSQKSQGGNLVLPFRESKLTRLLKPCLDGTSRLCLVCTLSPATESEDASLQTLAFAAAVSSIHQDACSVSSKASKIANQCECDKCSIPKHYSAARDVFRDLFSFFRVFKSQQKFQLPKVVVDECLSTFGNEVERIRTACGEVKSNMNFKLVKSLSLDESELARASSSSSSFPPPPSSSLPRSSSFLPDIRKSLQSRQKSRRTITMDKRRSMPSSSIISETMKIAAGTARKSCDGAINPAYLDMIASVLDKCELMLKECQEYSQQQRDSHQASKAIDLKLEALKSDDDDNDNDDDGSSWTQRHSRATGQDEKKQNSTTSDDY